MVSSVANSNDTLEQQVWQIACAVPDPEIPVVTLGDLGIVREVVVGNDKKVTVKLTPTYSGCPAVQVIEDSVEAALNNAGLICQIERVIFPSWTTDWISKEGREKLRAYGIAPPAIKTDSKPKLFERDSPNCPRCQSNNTKLVSQFGATPCKAHYQCENCAEPFDYFKCL